jgi:hypothetical protein
MLPAAACLIETGCGGLILDVKGDYVTLADRYPDRITRQRPEAGAPINLIAGLGISTLRVLLDNLRQPFATREPYWGSLGVEDALLIAAMHRELGDDPPWRISTTAW